jgi:hypothetical protein
MIQNKHLYGSKQTWFKTNAWFKRSTYMVQNKHLPGSKQTLIWFKTNTYMAQSNTTVFYSIATCFGQSQSSSGHKNNI